MMELDSEVHAHAHKVGHRWIDLIVALSALALSITSIINSMQNEDNMRRLVTANSWPHIALNDGGVTATGEPVIHFEARNSGIGPATLEKPVMTYNGRPVASAKELLEDCCASDIATADVRVTINAIENHVFTPHETLIFLHMEKTGPDTALWQKLNSERGKINMTACYS